MSSSVALASPAGAEPAARSRSGRQSVILMGDMPVADFLRALWEALYHVPMAVDDARLLQWVGSMHREGVVTLTQLVSHEFSAWDELMPKCFLTLECKRLATVLTDATSLEQDVFAPVEWAEMSFMTMIIPMLRPPRQVQMTAQWMQLLILNGGEGLMDPLRETWSTVAFSSSIIAVFALQNLISAPAAITAAELSVQRAYVFSQGLSFITGLMATLMVVTLIAQLQLFPDKLRFLATLNTLIDLPAVLLLLTCLSMIAALAVFLYSEYDRETFIVSVSVLGSMTLLLTMGTLALIVRGVHLHRDTVRRVVLRRVGFLETFAKALAQSRAAQAAR